MIRISQLKLKVGHTREELFEEIIHQAHGKRPVSWRIVRKSVDARKKPQLFYVYTIDAEFENEKKLLSAKKSKWTRSTVVKYRFPYNKKNGSGASSTEVSTIDRAVIVGMGPAGLFAALVLARAGFAPIVFERGDCVEKRSEIVEHFFESGELDEESNVQFGEGGAGTFSDGKLNTLVKDKFGRNHFVLKEFVKHGAPEEILYEAKPHIGTDILKDVVASIRKEIESLGGEVHFRTKVCDILCEKISGSVAERERAEAEKNLLMQDKQLTGLILEKEGVQAEYPCRNVIFAIGHSARDTFLMLQNRNIAMEQKSFSVGARIEHSQEMINKSQYGKAYKKLPAADYKMAVHLESGRGVYTFCMCPGGRVVASASEDGGVVTNGMSYFARDGKNANSALLVNVTPSDFKTDDPLAGMYFQREIEQRAFEVGGKNYNAPCQRVGDFLGTESNSEYTVEPTYKPNVTWVNLDEVFPKFITDSMREGIVLMDNKLHGFADNGAVITGPETRSSSPVRIIRDKKTMQSNIKGLYPCGEGAGYAGGIMSAAVDGIKTAEMVVINNGRGKNEQ